MALFSTFFIEYRFIYTYNYRLPTLPIDNSYKYFGIYLDAILKFDIHIENLESKIS